VHREPQQQSRSSTLAPAAAARWTIVLVGGSKSVVGGSKSVVGGEQVRSGGKQVSTLVLWCSTTCTIDVA
jgi:hypothetical protein